MPYKFTDKEKRNPLQTLTEFRDGIKNKLLQASNASNPHERNKLYNEAYIEYNDKMGSLNQLRSNANPDKAVEAVVQELKELKDQIKNDQEELEQRLQNAKDEEPQIQEEKRRAAEIKANRALQRTIDKAAKKEEQKGNAQKQARRARPKEESPKVTIVEQQDQNKPDQEKAEKILKKINQILFNFNLKIQNIGQGLAQARDVAVELHDNMVKARDEYAYSLQHGNTSENEPISFEEAGQLFKATCESAVNAVLPVLEKDLGWGDYLKNMLIAIANAVVSVVTLGKTIGFFPYAKPSADEAVQTNKELQDIDTTQPKI